MAAVLDLVSNLEEHARENGRMRETLEAIGRMIDRVTWEELLAPEVALLRQHGTRDEEAARR